MIIGGAAAMIALIAGIMAQVDSTTIMERAGIAFVVGWILGLIWQMLSTIGGKVELLTEEEHARTTDSHAQTPH